MARPVTESRPTTRQLREFGVVVGSLVPLVCSGLLPALRHHSPPVWPLWIGLPLFVLGLVAPETLRLPYRGWMALGHALGWVNGRIVLTLVYWLVLQPIAAVMRLCGHDPLRRRWDANVVTYREVHPAKPTNLKTPF